MTVARSLLASFVLLAASAHAATSNLCSIFGTTYIVGDKPSDSACTHNDIQSAIDDVACPNTTIYVTQGHLWQGQHLLIDNATIHIEGTNASDCSAFVSAGGNNPPPTGPAITISGTGHSGDSVISIHDNSNVTLRYLQISDGRSDMNQDGGGIFFHGTGSLLIEHSSIYNNFAGYGGGLDLSGDGGELDATLQAGTTVAFNTAQYDGGGIRVGGSAHLFVLGTAASISFNTADGVENVSTGVITGGNGGGLAVFAPATADIGSGSLAVFANAAVHGGGIAVLGSDISNSVVGTVRLFPVIAGLPVGVSGNTASIDGGAVYLRNKIDLGGNGDAKLCAKGFAMNDNSAPEGAAVRSDYDTFDTTVVAGSHLFFDYLDCNVAPTTASLGAVACNGEACNVLSGNSAQDASEQPTRGSIIYLDNPQDALFNRFTMSGNSAAQMVTFLTGRDSSDEAEGASKVSNCVIADNHTQHEIVHMETADPNQSLLMDVDQCTIADNTIDDGYVFFAKGGFNLTRSIIWQPGRSTIDYLADGCSGCETTQDVISNDVSTFSPTAPGVQAVADPMFVDAAHGDYRLAAFVQNGQVHASLAIDYTDADGGADRDGNARDADVPLVDHGGVRDIGAYEAQPIGDRIFADAFGDPTSLLRN